MHSLNTMHSCGHTLHTDVSEEKMLGCHSWIVYIVRERKHCPRTQFLTKTGGTDCPSNSSSLPLSMSSCSNELDHTSDAAEDHHDGQDSLLPSYYSPVLPASAILLNNRLLIPLSQFSVGFLQKLLPIFQRRSIPSAPPPS